MTRTQKLINVFLFLALGSTCLAVGAYFGSMYGGDIMRSVILIDNQDRIERIYECGSSPELGCFKASFSELATSNYISASILMQSEYNSPLHSKLRDVRDWNEQVAKRE